MLSQAHSAITCLASKESIMNETLFDKYGGFDTLSTVVANFYDKVLDSDSLRPYFENVNMDRLIWHQTKFITRVLGGPDEYEGDNLKKVHARFNITTIHFEEVLDLMGEALEEAGVTEEDIALIAITVNSYKDQIVS